MRILLVTGIYPPDAGGPATYTRALARALAFSGEHRVQVVAYGDTDGVDEKDGYPVERIGRNRDVLTRYWNFFVAVFMRARDVDVVYLQGPVSEGLPGALAAKLVGKPILMKIVGDYAWEVYAGNGGSELLDEFLTRRHSGKIGWIERIERWTAKQAKKIIVPSEYLKGVVTKWGIPAERIHVITNAVETIAADRDRDDLRRMLGVDGKRVLLTSVRAVPWKGGDFLIDLMPDLPQDVHLVIAGDGPSLDAWKKQAGGSDRVQFLGRVDQQTLGDWYRAADLFVLASGYEGFPHVVPEAVAAGTSCIVSDKGGNPETQTLLGADRVRVLPYRDRTAWHDALSGTWPPRVASAMPRDLQMDELIKKTSVVLQSSV